MSDTDSEVTNSYFRETMLPQEAPPVPQPPTESCETRAGYFSA